ncbi:MAG: hypothetical protein ACRDZP_08770 [Acidimicrobiales bacterium]
MSSPGLLDVLAGPPRPLSLVELARVLGGLRWLELQGFERWGRLAIEPWDKAVAGWASGASLAHAWRASQLEALLPVSVGLPSASQSTCPHSPELEETAAETLPGDPVGPAPDGGKAERTTPADPLRLLGLLASAYRVRLAHPHQSADKPVLRVLSRLVSDVEFRLIETAEIFPLSG